jgi:hypothetical protein
MPDNPGPVRDDLRPGGFDGGALRAELSAKLSKSMLKDPQQQDTGKMF